MPKWIIHWEVSGDTEVEAPSAEAAAQKFDKMWGSPRGVQPERDGEITVGDPELKTED